MANTTTPFPTQLLRSAMPAMSIAAPSMAQTKRIETLTFGPFDATALAGNLLTGFPLTAVAPKGGKILSVRAYFTTAGTGTGADTNVNLELDTTNLSGGVANLLLANAGAGVITAGSAITAGNTFTSAGGVLDIEYAVTTAFTAGAFNVVVTLEVYEDNVVQTGAFGAHLVTRAGLLECIVARLGVCGSAGSTVVVARLNGDAIDGATVTFANDAADGTVKIIPCNVEVAAGDLIDINITTAPTAGSDLRIAPVISQQFVA